MILWTICRPDPILLEGIKEYFFRGKNFDDWRAHRNDTFFTENFEALFFLFILFFEEKGESNKTCFLLTKEQLDW